MKFAIKTLVLVGVLVCALCIEAQASIVTYVLNQSNIDAQMPDGIDYATVTIEDGVTYGADTDAVKFTVDVINSAFTQSTNFGIQEFVFNLAAGAPSVADNQIVGPSGWTGNIAPPNNQFDGFGRFGGSISTTGTVRQDPLVLWITGVVGDGIASYAAPSTNNAGQGNAWFGVHVAGITTSSAGVTSGFFGGGNGAANAPEIIPSVPVPAALWLFGSALSGMISLKRRKNS